MKSLRKRNAAFTLIEIMVVITIIVLLVALLLPVLAKVRATAKRSATQAQMSGIQMACENYYQMFRAYPSAISSRDYAPAVSTAGSEFSESQGLVVSLTSAIFPSGGTGKPTTTTGLHPSGSTGNGIDNSGGATPMMIAADQTPPRDYSDSSGTGFRNYNPFIVPKAGDLITTTCGLNPATDAPVFADSAYGSDAMPILYYRMDVKYDPSTGVPGVGNNVVLDNYSAATPPSAGVASFYLGANDYLEGLMVATGGTATNTCKNSQAGNLRIGKRLTGGPSYPNPGSTYLDELVAQNNGNGGYAIKGAFVLISAGNDRIYGRNFNTGVPGGVAPDDIVVAGGN